MLLHDQPSRASVARLAGVLFPVLLIGLAFGWRGAAPSSTADDATATAPSDSGARDLRGGFASPSDSGAMDVEGMESLSLDFPERSMERLMAARERALERGLIVQQDDDWVDATVSFRGEVGPARVRLKGDWLDHVETEQWSLRIELRSARVLGMRVFSIQSPQTVGFLWEWVAHRLMRDEDVLAPRSTFVRVRIDGEESGVYFLQEHFAKELLESQGRREAAIVRFDESTHWDLLLQNELTLPGPPPIRSGLVVDAAEVRPFGGRHLAASEALARGLDVATEQMKSLRALAIEARTTTDRLRRLQALVEVEERDLDASVDIDAMARFHAVASLLQVEHGLFWHNLRFAFDPVSERLEPIAFDLMAQTPSDPDPVPLRGHGFVTRFGTSRAYYDGVFRHLGRLTAAGVLEESLGALAPEIARFASGLPQGAEQIVRRRLLTERDYLRRVVCPGHGANYAATVFSGEGGAPAIEVRAWATTRAPMVVEAFRFENGIEVPAGEAVVEGQTPMPRSEGSGGQRVVLPGDGREVLFRFPANERLAGLTSVKALIRATTEAGEVGGLDIRLEAIDRPIADLGVPREQRPDARSVALWLRPREERWSAEGGRPAAPTRTEVLERHPFLGLDAVTGELVAVPGRNDVQGDLVLPEGIGLRIPAGTELRFAPGALLLATGPLHFEGTEEAPVRLVPLDPGTGWGGIVVLGARQRSSWEFVEVRGTTGLLRGGFAPSGGVTFENSPVSISDSFFDGSSAGDALNVIRCEVHLRTTRFRGAASDSFDGDFVSGDATECIFEEGGGDGVDLSGSHFEVRNSRFSGLADKAISAGEGTDLSVSGGLARGVSIGVAAKDGSRVLVRGFGLEEVEHFALAVYTKKLAFGPAELRAERLRGSPEVLGQLLVQEGSLLTVEGRVVEAGAFDVQELYRAGVLGK